MKLYYSPGACSLASHILLRESNATFSLAKVDTATHVTEAGADYYGINSKGQVPLLELPSGERLSEGPVISQYIAELAQAQHLLPKSDLARYRVLEWQNYVSTELHKSFTPLFNPDLDAGAKRTLRGTLRNKYQWLDAQLQDRRYLTGETFTIADAYLFVVTNWAKYVALELDDLSNVQAFQARVAARPAVRAAMVGEGLLAA